MVPDRRKDIPQFPVHMQKGDSLNGFVITNIEHQEVDRLVLQDVAWESDMPWSGSGNSKTLIAILKNGKEVRLQIFDYHLYGKHELDYPELTSKISQK